MPQRDHFLTFYPALLLLIGRGSAKWLPSAAEPLPGIINNNRTTRSLSNHFDCAALAGPILGPLR